MLQQLAGTVSAVPARNVVKGMRISREILTVKKHYRRRARAEYS